MKNCIFAFLAKKERSFPPRFLPLKSPERACNVKRYESRKIYPPPYFRRGDTSAVKPRFGPFSLTTFRCDKQFVDSGKVHKNRLYDKNQYEYANSSYKSYPGDEIYFGRGRKSELNFRDNKDCEKDEFCNTCKQPKYRHISRRVTFEGLEDRPRNECRSKCRKYDRSGRYLLCLQAQGYN